MDKVKDREYLYKNPKTKVVVNYDHQGLALAKSLKKKRLAELNRERELHERIERLELMVEKLLGVQQKHD